MKISIQLNFKKKSYVLIEKKNHNSCSMCNFRSAVQGPLSGAFKFQPKWKKFAREQETPPL